MGFPVVDTPEVYLTACRQASRLNHHLFDTLYHAVGLHAPKATLVTADEHYWATLRRPYVTATDAAVEGGATRKARVACGYVFVAPHLSKNRIAWTYPAPGKRWIAARIPPL
ncbi:MAG: hypothetical protein AB9873_12775 [Syntrophobacteraceae bacterium]